MFKKKVTRVVQEAVVVVNPFRSAPTVGNVLSRRVGSAEASFTSWKA